MNAPATLADLHRLLDEDQALPPETATGLTSHLPMALQALQALGASAARLQAFRAAHQAHFHGEAGSVLPGIGPDWRAGLGRFDAYVALRSDFLARLADTGRDALLRETLPLLLQGAAAGALHGPIRVAHAVQAGHDGELASALAYWAARWQPVAPPQEQPQDLPFDTWTAALTDAALRWTAEAPLITLRIRLVELSPHYQALAGRLQAPPDLLPRLTRFAARGYARTRAFTVLHLVTGLRAIRLLMPWVDATAQAAAGPALVHAFTAAWLAARMTAWPELPPAPALPWGEMVRRAVASDDDHVIKLVHAALELSREDDDPVFAAAAARAVA